MARILRFAALTLLAAIFFSTPIARADLYTLTFERSMPLPAANTFAIAWGDDGTLWTHSQGVMNFYHLNPTSGAVLTSFPSNNNTLLGLDLQGGILYGAEEPTIVRFDEATGAQLTSITGPVTGGARGITFVGGECYVAGVLAGHPGEVRLGHIDPSTGTLLGSCLPPNLVYTQYIGGIGPYVCYVMQSGSDETLRIVDPTTGALIEDHVLFPAGFDVYYGCDASPFELFVSRRDMGEIWVYSLTGATPTTSSSWGRVKALYR